MDGALLAGKDEAVGSAVDEVAGAAADEVVVGLVVVVVGVLAGCCDVEELAGASSFLFLWKIFLSLSMVTTLYY